MKRNKESTSSLINNLSRNHKSFTYSSSKFKYLKVSKNQSNQFSSNIWRLKSKIARQNRNESSIDCENKSLSIKRKSNFPCILPKINKDLLLKTLDNRSRSVWRTIHKNL